MIELRYRNTRIIDVTTLYHKSHWYSRVIKETKMISLGLVNTVKVKIILVVTKLGEVFQVQYSFSDKISNTIKATLSETYQMLQKNFQ